jgi:hypothetical protein
MALDEDLDLETGRGTTPLYEMSKLRKDIRSNPHSS